MNISYNHVEYLAMGKGQKLLNQRADYNPVVDSGYVRYMYRDGAAVIHIQDDDASFGTYTNHLLHYQDAKADEVIAAASAVTDVYEYSDGVDDEHKELGSIYETAKQTEVGDVDNTYFDNGNFEAANVYGVYNDSPNLENIAIVYDMYFAVKSGVNVSSLTFEAWIKTNDLADFSLVSDTTNNDPVVGIKEKDSVGDTFDVEYIRKADTGSRYSGFTVTDSISGHTGITPWVYKTVTVSASISNYLESIATNGNFTLYRVKCVIGSGQTGVPKHIYNKLGRLIVTLDSDQAPDAGVCEITSNTSTDLSLGDITNGEEPMHEGIGTNDVYIITDTLDDQINTLASNWGITITDNITNSNITALTDDYTNKTRYEVFQDICNLTNSIWYYDPVNDAFLITSVDNLSSTSITLTNADVVDWQQINAWSYKIDADKIRDTVRVVGGQNVDPQSSSPTVEFSHALGNEEVIIQRPDIQSEFVAARVATNEAKKYTNARRTLTLQLDYDNPNQSYSAIAIGKTIAVQLPDASDTSVCNHTSGNDGELLITSMQYDIDPEKGNRKLVTLTLQTRDS